MIEVIQGGLSDVHRKVVYGAYAVLGVIFGGIQVGYSAAEMAQPLWLKISLAVFTFLGGAIGYTALSNVTTVREVKVENADL